MKIAIIDYGAGNTKSVEFSLARIGCEAILTSDANAIQQADGVIFPGVGHASIAMLELKRAGLDQLIPRLKQPVLGVCLGMQLMCSSSEEGETQGLGIFDATVKKFTDRVKIPQVGWNSADMLKGKLFKEIDEEQYFYFVHSYYVPTTEWTVATADYDGIFSAALQRDNFYGCQFHPEKSGVIGEQLLKNFIELCE